MAHPHPRCIESAPPENLYQAAFDEANEAYLVFDLKTKKVLEANKRAIELFDLPHSEFLNQSFRIICQEQAPFIEHIADFLKKKDRSADSESFEWSCRKRNGQTFLAECTLRPIHFDGQTALLTSIRDMSAQKQKLRDLKQTEQLFKILFGASYYGIAIQTIEGKFLMVNAAFCSRSGYTEAEILGKSWLELGLLPTSEIPAFKSATEALANLSTIENKTGKLVTKEGHVKTVLYSASPIQFDHQPSILSILVDITEMKNTEQLLSLERDLGTFLSQTSSLDEALVHSLDTAIKASGMDSGGIYLLDENNWTLTLFTSKGISKNFTEQIRRYPTDAPITSLVMKGKPVYQDSAIHNHAPDFVELTGIEGLKTVAIIPILAAGKVIGSLNIASHTNHIMPENARHTLESICSQIGSALLRAKAETARKESEERLRMLINAMPDIVCFKDGHGRWLEANTFDLKLFQLEGVKYQGKTDADLIQSSPAYKNAFEACLESDEIAWRKGNVSRMDETILTPNGPPRVFDVIKIPTFFSDGSRKGLIVVGRDITERKKAEEQSQLNEARLEALVSLAQKSHLSLQEITDFSLQQGVTLTSSTLGYVAFIHEPGSSIELFSQYPPHPTNQAPSADAVWTELINQKQPLLTNEINAETSVPQWPLGSAHVSRHMHIPVFDGDKMVAIAGVGNKESAYDEADVRQLTLLMEGMWRIFQRKKTEEYLRTAKEAAEKTNQLKSEFLDIAAHELRTPLTALSTLVQLTSKGIQSGRQINLQIIQRLSRQIDRLENLVNDLLNVSRLERGVMKISKQESDLTSTIVESVDGFRYRNPKRDFLLKAPPEPIYLDLDPDRIEQVLSNFLDNAVKYSPEESPIEIEITSDQKKVRISVTDHGQGIVQAHQDSLFTRFFRVTTDDTLRHPGLGLGLYISKQIIELHQGTIGVRSEPGKGSTFFFELPNRQDGK